MSSRIDWRNYDYSEGPPKPSQRDTNPYSKTFALKARSTTPSPVNHAQDSENAIDHFQMNNSTADFASAMPMRGDESMSNYSHGHGHGNINLSHTNTMRRNNLNTSIDRGSDFNPSPRSSPRAMRSSPRSRLNEVGHGHGHGHGHRNTYYNGQRTSIMPDTDTATAMTTAMGGNMNMPSQKLSYRPASSGTHDHGKAKAKAVQIHRSLATSSYTQLAVNASSSTRIEEDEMDMAADGTMGIGMGPMDMDADMQMQMEPRLSAPADSEEPFDVMEDFSVSTTKAVTVREMKRERMTSVSTRSHKNPHHSLDYEASHPRPVTPKDDEDPHHDSRSKGNGYARRSFNDEVVSLSSTRKNNDFNDVWNEAEEEWEQAQANNANTAPIQMQRIISDEDDDINDEYNGMEEAPLEVPSEEGNDDEYDHSHAPVKGSDYEFESFAGDRSINTGRSSGKTRNSEASLEKMDIPRTVAPVSILRSGRFDRSKSPKRKHPWDKDYVEGESGPIGEERKNGESYNNFDQSQPQPLHVEENETYQEDETNLQRYEAEDNTDLAESDLQQDLIAEVPVSQTQTYRHDYVRRHHDDSIVAEHDVLEEPEVMDNQPPVSPKDERKERRRRSRRRDGTEDHGDFDEDDSIEDDIGNSKTRADTLQDRTKMAWSKRNQIAATSMAPLAPPAIGPVRKDSEKRLVSFQQETSVHEFTKESDEDESDEDSSSSGTESDDKTEGTDYTDEGSYTDDDTHTSRSMHSVYTKSNESEVEDLLKDIFFVGSGKATIPGKRELKYRKDNKERLRREKLERQAKRENKMMKTRSSDGDGNERQAPDDASTFDDQEASATNKKSLNGLSGNDTDDEESQMDSTVSRGYEEEYDPFTVTYSYCEDFFRSLGNVCGITPKTKRIENQEASKEISTLESWENYLTDFIFRTDLDTEDEVKNDENREALLELSMNAAKVKHSLEEVEFDEKHSLDVQKDIKFLFLSLALPIGIVFSESPSGCWAKRIFENGNAASDFKGDKLEVGDHLVSINGASVMHKTVAEICRILADAPNANDIELSFIRYVGPLQVSSNEQQGYEVIDPRLLEKGGKFSPHLQKSKPIKNDEAEAEDTPSTPVEVIRVKAKRSERQKSRSPVKSPAKTQLKLPSKSPVKTPASTTRTTNHASPIYSSGKKKKKKKVFGLFRIGKKKNKESTP